MATPCSHLAAEGATSQKSPSCMTLEAEGYANDGQAEHDSRPGKVLYGDEEPAEDYQNQISKLCS